jgi:hypothetical protein
VAREWAETDRRPDVAAERLVEGILDRVLRIASEDPLRSRFSAEGHERFGTWRRELEQRVRSGRLSPAIESHLPKSRSLLPKLALIFQLAESDGMESEIPLVQAERAAAVCGYLERPAHGVYGSVTSLPQRLAAVLAHKLLSGALGERSACAIFICTAGRRWTLRSELGLRYRC